MQNKIARWIAGQQLISPGQKIICAVSGGSDSVAMLHVLNCLSGQLGIRLEAAHFNHCLRSDESDRDEAFVRSLCQKLCVPLVRGCGDVAARASLTGESLEEAARHMRYEFLESLEGIVATAHTADDNLETFLINSIRGTGLTGLSGIPAKRGSLIRPMLCVSREEIEAYLQREGLPHVEDSTNADDNCLRNRLRHHVVPLLKAENPALCETMLRTCSLLRSDNDCLETLASALLKEASVSPCSWRRADFMKQPDAIRTRAIRKILQEIQAPKLSSTHIQLADRLVFSDSPSARVTLPGGWVFRREYDMLCLAKDADGGNFVPELLDPDGTTLLALCGVSVSCRTYVLENLPSRPFTFRCSNPAALTARPRQEGDRILLSYGSKTIKKLMIDLKIPADVRCSIPIICDDTGILCVGTLAENLEKKPSAGDTVVEIHINPII